MTVARLPSKGLPPTPGISDGELAVPGMSSAVPGMSSAVGCLVSPAAELSNTVQEVTRRAHHNSRGLRRQNRAHPVNPVGAGDPRGEGPMQRNQVCGVRAREWHRRRKPTVQDGPLPARMWRRGEGVPRQGPNLKITHPQAPLSRSTRSSAPANPFTTSEEGRCPNESWKASRAPRNCGRAGMRSSENPGPTLADPSARWSDADLCELNARRLARTSQPR